MVDSTGPRALPPADMFRQWALLLAASLAATIPVWVPTFPPMTDLPQHASQIGLLARLQDPDFAYSPLFHVNWFTPYLLGYLLVYVLTPIVGIVAACKVVVSLALAGLPLATALVMSETETDRRFAILTIPCMYGFSYYWGFLNFLVAAPVGLIFVWLTLRQARRPTAGGTVGLAVAVVVLFFCHAMICVFFGAIAGFILLSTARSPRAAIRAVLPLAVAIPVMLLWALRTLDNPLAHRPILWDLNWMTTGDPYYAIIADWTTPRGWGWGRTAGLLPRMLGAQPGVLTTLFGSALFLLPVAAGARFSRRPVAWIPLAVATGTVLFAPGILFGTDFTFQRFSVFVLPLFLLTLAAPPGRSWPRWTWPACVLLAGTWVALVSAAMVRYQGEAEGFEKLLARMEPGQRALSFTFERDSSATIAPAFLHFPSWYSALKGGVVDPNIAGTHVQLVLYRRGQQPPARLWEFEWNPGLFHWRRYRGSMYRYFVVKASQDRSKTLFFNATCKVRLVERAGHWWLYERAADCRPAKASSRS